MIFIQILPNKEIDEIELNGVKQVICKKFKYSKDKPLLIGSIKSVIGHSEGAASLVAIVKIIIAMENRIIPANRNISNVNSMVEALKSGVIKVIEKI